jgi:hypothetical protein
MYYLMTVLQAETCSKIVPLINPFAHAMAMSCCNCCVLTDNKEKSKHILHFQVLFRLIRFTPIPPYTKYDFGI